MPAEKAGGVLGRAGTVLKETEGKFGVRIFIQQATEQGLRRMVIRAGPKDSTEHCYDCMAYVQALAAAKR